MITRAALGHVASLALVVAAASLLYGCGSRCPRTGAERFFAVLELPPADGGVCGQSVSGKFAFTSSEAATIQEDGQAAGNCAVAYSGTSDSQCEVQMTCQASFGTVGPALIRIDAEYDSSNPVIHSEDGLRVSPLDAGAYDPTPCTYGWSMTP